MFILFLMAFSLVYNLLFSKSLKPIVLKATPAYAPKKRLPRRARIPLPDFIQIYKILK